MPERFEPQQNIESAGSLEREIVNAAGNVDLLRSLAAVCDKLVPSVLRQIFNKE